MDQRSETSSLVLAMLVSFVSFARAIDTVSPRPYEPDERVMARSADLPARLLSGMDPIRRTPQSLGFQRRAERGDGRQTNEEGSAPCVTNPVEEKY